MTHARVEQVEDGARLRVRHEVEVMVVENSHPQHNTQHRERGSGRGGEARTPPPPRTKISLDLGRASGCYAWSRGKRALVGPSKIPRGAGGSCSRSGWFTIKPSTMTCTPDRDLSGRRRFIHVPPRPPSGAPRATTLRRRLKYYFLRPEQDPMARGCGATGTDERNIGTLTG